MKTSDYADIRRIEFSITHQCTGKCRHCSVGDRLNRDEDPRHVLPGPAAAMVETLSQSFGVGSLMTFGGEPLLYPDVVCALHAKAAECGIEKRQLITNGYFTADPVRRRDVARRLARSGVNDLLLSVDAFHQESIPLEAVYAFARDLAETDIARIRLQPAWVVSAQSDNSFNRRTREILAFFSPLGIAVAEGNNIFMLGRAVEHLKDYYGKPRLDLEERCGSMPYTEPLTEVTSISVEPDGNVMVCGFAIGSIYEEKIGSILSRYDPRRNACMSAIIDGGASGLLEYARKAGMEPDLSRCYSICDVCHDVARQMDGR